MSKENYEASEIYTVLYVDCPYCAATRELDRAGEYDQQVCCCQECNKKFVMLA